jgi:hypothetical protein
MRLSLKITLILTSCLWISPLIAGSTRAVGSVSLKPQTFNPKAGEAVDLAITFRKAGRASVQVVDRDGFAVRTIAVAKPVQGDCSFRWDDRDATGRVVADETYAFRIEWADAKSRELWFPADQPSTPVSIPPRYFDRRSGTLAYTLPRASRVHIQAGTAVFDTQGKVIDGPSVKTVVNRDPEASECRPSLQNERRGVGISLRQTLLNRSQIGPVCQPRTIQAYWEASMKTMLIVVSVYLPSPMNPAAEGSGTDSRPKPRVALY